MPVSRACKTRELAFALNHQVAHHAHAVAPNVQHMPPDQILKQFLENPPILDRCHLTSGTPPRWKCSEEMARSFEGLGQWSLRQLEEITRKRSIWNLGKNHWVVIGRASSFQVAIQWNRGSPTPGETYKLTLPAGLFLRSQISPKGLVPTRAVLELPCCRCTFSHPLSHGPPGNQ